MKKSLILLLVLIFSYTAYVFLSLRETYQVTEVRLNGKSIKVEVADTPEKRDLGLMYRTTLPADEGMLFVFPEVTAPEFWMKETYIPLDIIFIGQDKTINHIEKDVPPCREPDPQGCPRYSSPYPTQFVLEVTAGYSDQHALKAGDRIEFNVE